MADFAAARGAATAGFTDGVGREVVVKEEFLLLRAAQAVDILFVFSSAERGDAECLRFAAGEQRRAVGARQDADRARSIARTWSVLRPSMRRAGADDVTANDLGFGFLEDFLEHQGVSARSGSLRFSRARLLPFHGRRQRRRNGQPCP